MLGDIILVLTDGDLAWSGVDLLPQKFDELGAGDPGEGDFEAECAHNCYKVLEVKKVKRERRGVE